MREHGLVVPAGGVKADGRLHRCDTDDGPSGRGDGAYVLFLYQLALIRTHEPNRAFRGT